MNVTHAIVSTKRIIEIHNMNADITYKTNSTSNIKCSVTFDHIYFKYSDDEYVLKDISFNANYGKTIGIIRLTLSRKSTQAKEFIDKFPKRYNTFIYQKGSNLSGGQRQHVSIVRGLVGNPKILILDDSTSALDTKSEALVKEALAKNILIQLLL